MAKPSVRNMEKVGHLFNLTEKNQIMSGGKDGSL